jgi:hypothetical protein
MLDKPFFVVIWVILVFKILAAAAGASEFSGITVCKAILPKSSALPLLFCALKHK